MTVYSFGYEPNPRAAAEAEKAFSLYCDNLSLIIQHQANILSCADYFYCRLPFAYCSWSCVAGDGPLCLGYLLLGGQQDILTGTCPDCGAKVLVTSFSGSILSGGNLWFGFCQSCKSRKESSWKGFSRHWNFVLAVRKQFPGEISHCAGPVTLNVLLTDLKTGKARNRIPPHQSCLTDDRLKLKFTNDEGETTIFGN